MNTYNKCITLLTPFKIPELFTYGSFKPLNKNPRENEEHGKTCYTIYNPNKSFQIAKRLPSLQNTLRE